MVSTIQNKPILDSKDYQILFQLEQDATQTLNEIAKKIRLKKETVFHRMKNLEKAGIIRSYLSEIDIFALGYQYYPALLKFGNTKPDIEKEIIDYLKKSPALAWLTRCEGYWDITFTAIAHENTDFNDFLIPFMEKYSQFIIEKQIFMSSEIHYFKRNFSLDEESAIIVSSIGENKIELNKEDLDLLFLISNNARMPLVKLAQKLHTTPRIAAYRLKKLKKQGAIQGARILVDFSKVSYKFYKIWFALKNLNKQKWKEFIDFFRQSGKVLWATKLIGAYDLSIELEVKDQDEFRAVLEAIKERFSDFIIKHESIQIFEENTVNYLPLKSE